MSEDIKAGDVVRLKSGGPEMTVSSVGDNYGQQSVWCEWFNEKTNPCQKVFALASVEKIQRGPSSAELAARGPKVV